MSDMIYDIPPVLQGSVQQQLQELRNYLVRQARKQGQQVAQQTETTAAQTLTGTRTGGKGGQGGGTQESLADQIAQLQRRAAALKALIIKTGDDWSAQLEQAVTEVEGSIDDLAMTISETYVTASQLGSWDNTQEGTYTAAARLAIALSAKLITEEYLYGETVTLTDGTTTEGMARAMEEYTTLMNGKIQRGFFANPDHTTDPSEPEYIFGIAIASSLAFGRAVKYMDRNGNLVDEEDLEDGDEGIAFYELRREQTMGIYASTGWQFWIGGKKRGWFDSADGELHVIQETIENSLTQGQWQVTAADGWGVMYVGA